MSGRRGEPSQLETLPGMDASGTIALAQAGAGELTAEQEEAVSRRAESLAVSAAAGSGKTSVLVERFVRAVREDGVAPGRILAITFTERAAGELRARVRARLLDLGERQAARDTEAAFVGTFHGFCARLLRAHPLAAGLDPDFEIVDEGQAARLRELAFGEAVRGFLAGRGDEAGGGGGVGEDGGAGERAEAVDVLAAYGVDRVRSMLERVYLELRSTGQRFPRLPRAALATDAEPRDVEAARVCALLDELLERFGRAYERGKRARARVDFDDLELLAQELLAGHESIRAAWSERFELLMVDEFQDTNRRQLEIVRALDRGNLFTVGDEFQSIYGFRHADVRLFRERRVELRASAASLSLTHNFRSRAPLLEVVNTVFTERFVEFDALRAGRREVEAALGPPASLAGVLPGISGASGAEPAVELLLTDAGGWDAEESLAASIAAGLPAASLWRQAEARLLAQRVAELVRSGRARPGEIVVLLRATGDIEVFERALQLHGLRTLAAVGAFWGRQQVGDLISYLRALANPLDEEALYGVLASPLGGCSRDCLALLASAAQAQRRGVWETALGVLDGEAGEDGRAGEDGELARRLGERDRDALARVCGLLREERASASRRTIAALIERAIDASGYREHVLALDWGERRLANVQKLLRLARRFEADEGRDLRAFLDHAERLAAAAAVEPDAPVDGAEPDAVRLMTVHAAKGLEFAVVCVADLGRQPSLRMPDLLVDGERVGVRLLGLDGGESVAALDYEQLAAERRAREAEEEDRVFYVAMTRARELLVLSGAVDFARWARLGPSATPISWLAPALVEDLPARLASGEIGSEELLLGDDGAVRVRFASPAAPPQAPASAPVEPRQMPLRATLAPPPAPPASTPQQASRAPAARAPTAGEARARERMSSLSYSSLTELERCGYRYYLERVLGLAEDRAQARADTGSRGLEARARGTLVHRLMETLDFLAPRAPTAQDVARCAGELGLRVGALERSELAELVGAASRAAPAQRIARAASVRREHPFAFSLGSREPLITGVIDLLAVEPDGAHVVLDYKSDRVAPDADLEALVQREYAIQRLLYALAALREGAASVEIVHWFLEREEWVAARYRADDRASLEEALAARLASARERPFAVSEHPHRSLCETCPGRAGLCSWGGEWTLRERPDEDVGERPVDRAPGA